MPDELINFFPTLEVGAWVLLGLAAAVYLLRIGYDILFWGRTAFCRVAPPGAAAVQFTVFMVERNEEANLRQNLPSWLSMSYPHYEVVVVDDFSEDHSLATLGVLRQQYSRLKITGLNQETRFSGKLARNLALKAAAHEVVVLVDPAAGVPDNHWLPLLASSVAAGKKVVAGYWGIAPGKGFFHRLYRAELFFQQTESMAYCLNGLPFVISEENVAFAKQAYFENGGFAGKIREEYAHLELVINSFVRRKQVAVLPVGNAAVRKRLNAGRQEYFDLLHRSFRIKSYLSFGKKLVLFFDQLSYLLLLPVFALVLILYPQLWLVVAILLFLKIILYSLIINKLLNRLTEPKLFLPSLLYGFLAPYGKLVVKWRFYRARQQRKWSN